MIAFNRNSRLNFVYQYHNPKLQAIAIALPLACFQNMVDIGKWNISDPVKLM